MSYGINSFILDKIIVYNSTKYHIPILLCFPQDMYVVARQYLPTCVHTYMMVITNILLLIYIHILNTENSVWIQTKLARLICQLFMKSEHAKRSFVRPLTPSFRGKSIYKNTILPAEYRFDIL